MKLLVILIFAGCAVKCDELGNYFVVERPSDEPVRDLKPFQVYWNVPTIQCKSKKIPFDSLYQRYGIIQNKNDSFQGEQVVILYDPGLFPAILKDDASGKLKFRNGGVPQEGNLDEHLTAFKYVLDHSIPDPEFNGIGIIDFESWRPVFRQNFGELTPYKNVSLLIERRQHPWWSKSRIEATAKYRFERAGREFMQATASLARLLRPRARWGYYGFPYCFNMAANNLVESCPNNVKKENDFISWLWSDSTALYPSVYSSKNLSSSQLAAMIRGRVTESARVGKGVPILPYFWYKYRDAGFMSEMDLNIALKTMYKSNASGFIIWGSSNDVNTVAKCEKLKNYLEQVLGPAIAQYTKKPYKNEISIEPNNLNDTKTFNVSTENPFDLMPSETKDENLAVNIDSEIDPEYGDTNEKYNDDISEKLAEEYAKSNDESVKPKKNIVIEILLSIVKLILKNDDKDLMEKEMVRINKDRKKGTPIHDTFTKLSDDNDLDLSTISPFSKNKKKGSIFTSLFTTALIPKLINETALNAVTSTTEFHNTSTTAFSVVSTTEFPNISTTAYSDVSTTELRNDDYSTVYNSAMSLDNYTTVTDQTTETLEFLYDNTTTKEYTDTTGVITDKTELSRNVTQPDISTTESTISTTDGTTAVYTGIINDSLSVASENNQVVISVV